MRSQLYHTITTTICTLPEYNVNKILKKNILSNKNRMIKGIATRCKITELQQE